MTELLKEAFRALAALPDDAQDMLAVAILAEARGDVDDVWQRTFAASEDALTSLADEAIEEVRAGRATPLDPRSL